MLVDAIIRKAVPAFDRADVAYHFFIAIQHEKIVELRRGILSNDQAFCLEDLHLAKLLAIR